MPRLIALGCSNTYGHGLSDCDAGPDPLIPGGRLHGPTPSQLAWPSVAAGLLGLECVNLSRPGNSNINMLVSLLDQQLAADDRVAILWSYCTRDALWDPDTYGPTGYTPVGHWMVSVCEANRAFYRAHSDYDLQLRTWLYHSAAADHLRALAVRFAMGSIEDWDQSCRVGIDHRNIPSSYFTTAYLDTASDGAHPGPLQHAEWGRIFAAALR